MNINVRSVKVLKTGENADHPEWGPWKLIKIVTDEGVEYTTLAKEADQISPGVTLNISNLDEDGKGRKSFKKFEYVQGMAKAPSPQPSDEQMTPDKWDEKDRITRASIERQVSMKLACELALDSATIEEIIITATTIYEWISSKEK